MKKTKTLNMTQGNPTRLLAIFALPMLIGNIFQQAYNFADSIIVGKYVGSSALAAVGATGSLTFLFFSICNGIGSGSGIVTAQYFGAGEPTRIKRSIANSAYIMMSSSIIMSVIAYLAAPWALTAMGTPADILSDAILYMRMSCIGVPLVGVYNYASSMLRALGDSRTPLYFLIFSCFLNIGLDILCVKTFSLGIFGAALATIIAQVIAGIGCLIYAFRCNSYFRLTRDDCRVDPDVIRASVRLGLPLAMQWSMVAVSTTAMQTFINSFGTTAVAAFTATSRVEQLAHMPYGSLSTALATYAGQNYGARRMDRVKDGLRHGMRMSAIFTVVLMAAYYLFGNPIMSMFVDKTEAISSEVISVGYTGMKITSWFFIFLAVINMTRGILNGIGDALFAFINGFVEIVCRIVIPMIIVLVPGIGLWSIWWASGLSWMVSAIFCMLRYFSWRKKARDNAEGNI